MQNFVGYEDLRTKLQAAPKYGNDDDFADAIAADLWKWFSTCTMRLKMYRGHYCDAAVQMVQSNVGYGAMTGATPNGRLAGMPLSDTMSAHPAGRHPRPHRRGPGAMGSWISRPIPTAPC